MLKKEHPRAFLPVSHGIPGDGRRDVRDKAAGFVFLQLEHLVNTSLEESVCAIKNLCSAEDVA